MAADITSDRMEEQDGFWKYVLQHTATKKYLRGEVADLEGNTLFHYCAKSQNQEDAVKLLKLLPIDYYSGLNAKVNKNGDTMLHVALKKKKLDIYHEMIDRFNPYSGYICPWFNHILSAKNKAENTILTIAIKSSCISDQDIEMMMAKLRRKQIHSLCQITDRENNTVLHLVTMNRRHELITYLATQPVDVHKLNRAGLTSLHEAVKKDYVETLRHLYEKIRHREVDINEQTSERETAMHIAMKKGSKQMIDLLVEFGGDLDAQDEDGNTPLHDLIQLIHLDANEREVDNLAFQKVWKFLRDVCTRWWCKKFSKAIPDNDSDSFIKMRQEAMYHLRSGVKNKKGLTVLHYAAALGLDECVQNMLTEQDVFIFHASTSEIPKADRKLARPKYEIEVSNLMPEYYYKAPYSQRRDRPPVKGGEKNNSASHEDDQRDEEGEERTKLLSPTGDRGRSPVATIRASESDILSTSFLETLSYVKPPVKVSAVLETFPMELLARHQWYVYQILFINLLVFHTSVMTWYTYESQISVKRLNGTFPNRNIIDTTSADFVIMIYILTLLSLTFMSYVYHKVLKRKHTEKSKAEEDEGFPDYIETKGAILNGLTYLVAFIAEHLIKILFLAFGIGSVLLVIFGCHLDEFTAEHYAWIKGIVIFSGWLLVLAIGRAYSPIYNFVTILKYIFVKDMVPFLLFYVVLSIAFGCAIQLQFQLLSEETFEEHGTTWLVKFITSSPHVVWELFILAAGMDTDIKNIQSVGHMFTVNKYKTFYVELLLLLYGLASIVILLNMLIAAMNTTYSNVIDKQGKGWRQFQVSLGPTLSSEEYHN